MIPGQRPQVTQFETDIIPAMDEIARAVTIEAQPLPSLDRAGKATKLTRNAYRDLETPYSANGFRLGVARPDAARKRDEPDEHPGRYARAGVVFNRCEVGLHRDLGDQLTIARLRENSGKHQISQNRVKIPEFLRAHGIEPSTDIAVEHHPERPRREGLFADIGSRKLESHRRYNRCAERISGCAA